MVRCNQVRLSMAAIFVLAFAGCGGGVESGVESGGAAAVVEVSQQALSRCDGAAAGSWGYCTRNCPCRDGEGDCDGDNECGPGLSCVRDVGAQYGWQRTVDVCQALGGGGGGDCHGGNRPGGWSYCSAACPCSAGNGDCDNDRECQAGLRCVDNVGGNYGWSGNVDVCERPEAAGPADCHGGAASGSWSYCTVGCPCSEGHGDCDADNPSANVQYLRGCLCSTSIQDLEG